ncbi:MAG: carboxypeptidase regulatory-like domain-containing protein [Flavobacteriaceae bacterium]
MKYIYLVFCFLGLGTGLAFAQNVKLSGQVTDDTGQALEMANVIAFDAETNNMIGYSITDASGRYKLNVPKSKTYNIRISFIGFTTLNEEVIVATEDVLANFKLLQEENTLDAVELSYEMPVTIKGDTIVYDADSFNNGTEKKLEDVLANLPGVEIDDNGEVEVEGKKVGKVLVNGKEFFDGDTKVATQNIPANAIDKVEVLKNYSEVASMSRVRNNEDNIALNIKLKTGKDRFWFGEVSAGAGMSEYEPDGEVRYAAKPKLFYYSPNTSVNILADFNNTGEPPFTRQDYFRFTGGLNSGPRDSYTNVNVSDAGLGFTTTQNNRALEITSNFGAINFSHSPSETLDIGGFGIYNNAKTYIKTESRTLYNNSGLRENRIDNTEQESNQGIFKFNLSYIPNSDLQLDYDIIAKKDNQTEMNDVESDARAAADTDLDESPTSINQNLNLYYTINNKNILSAEGAYLYQENEPFFNSISEDQPFSVIPADPNQSIYRLNQLKKLETNKADLKLDYYFLVNNQSNLNLAFGTTYLDQDYLTFMEQELDSGETVVLADSDLENDVSYSFRDVFGGLFYNMVSGIFTLKPGVTVHNYFTEDRQNATTNTVKNTVVLPSVYARLQFKSSESLRFNYNMSTEFVDIGSRSEGYILQNYNSLYGGNRHLDYATYNRFSVSYFMFSMFSFTNIVARLSYDKKTDAIKNQIVLLNNGVDRVSTPINSEFADESFTGLIRYGKTLKNLKLNASANINQSRYTNIVDDQAVQSENLSQTYRLTVASNFKNAPNLELGYQKSINKYTDQKSTTDRPFARLDMIFLKNFILNADYDYYSFINKGQNLDNTYGFLNAQLFYQQKDSKWEFSLTGNNLTNNETLVTDRFNELNNSTQTTLYYVQPRLWLLTVKYNL